jgi:hypothetical protein
MRFQTIELAERLDPQRCPDRGARCLVEQYRKDGVHIVVLGRVEKKKLAFDVYETWTGQRSFDGAIAVADVNSATLRRHIGDIVRPIVQHGGLADDRPKSVTPSAPVPDKRVAPKITIAPQRSNLVLLLLAAAIVLVASPILLALILVGRDLGKRERPASWKWSALLLVVLSMMPVAVSIFDVSGFLVRLAAPAMTTDDLIPPTLAGMLWGAFLLAVGVWLFAPIHGMQHIRHDALWPLMRSWITLTLLRSIALFFLYAPILFLVWKACKDVALPESVTTAFLLPLAGLLAHFCLLSLVDNLSVYLDTKLVTGVASARNPWHATIKRYFRGYIRRNGVNLEEKAFERTLFLPSARADVISYGGGFAQPRVLVGDVPRETALGELPDEEEFPDRTVNMEELPTGFLVASMRERDDLGQYARAEDRRRGLTLAAPRPRQPMPRLVGENATLLGWVIAQSKEEGLPLISDTEDDFGIVKRLLSEHYAAFEWNIDGEVDDTDPTQKDFLFGAILREMGVILRHDTLFSTLRWTIEVASQRVGFIHRFVVRPPLALYERFLAWPAARIGDAFAALNGAFHHLVQHLCLENGTDGALLTARANEPQLVKASHEMLSRPEAEDDDRIQWLARYFHAALAPQTRVRWLRVAFGLALAAIAGVLLVRSAREAVEYHPKYVERMSTRFVIPEGGKGEVAR